MNRLSRGLTLGAGLVVTALAGAPPSLVHAQTVQARAADTAGAGLEIQEGVQISTLQKLTLNSGGVEALSPSANAMIDAVTVIQVSGDPGRAYRIRLPRFVTTEGRALIEELSAQGASGADATRQNATIATGGSDVIRLEGRLRVSHDSASGSTAMPLSVDVE